VEIREVHENDKSLASPSGHRADKGERGAAWGHMEATPCRTVPRGQKALARDRCAAPA
jgi:hypothetical protein